MDCTVDTASSVYVRVLTRFGVNVCAVLALCAVGSFSSAASGASSCDTLPPIQSPPAAAKVFSARSGSDDTADIQKAVNSLHPGDWLVFSAGTYTIGKHVTIPVDGVTLYGKGAIIHSTNPADGGFMVQGDNVSVLAFTLNQDSVARQTTPWSCGISVFDDRNGTRRRAQGTVIRGNTINNAAGAGIFLYKTSYFTVADNTIFRSWADGIHATGGSSYGRILHNSVSQNGDDMVGVVSYAGARNTPSLAQRYKTFSMDDLDHDIYVAHNELSDTYWGRGISVVGGSSITIEDNHISRTPTAAGIYLLRENSYTTFGDHNILVRNNVISQIQTSPPTYKPENIHLVLTHHGGIEISSQMSPEEIADPRYKDALAVSRVAILDNTISGARFDGLRIGAASGVDRTVTDVVVKGNTLEGVGSASVAAIYPGVDSSTLTCGQNKLNGTVWPSQCDKNVPATTRSPDVTGASLTCMADGTIQKSTAPNPPSDVAVQR